MQRDNSIDFARALAVITIVSSHFLTFEGFPRLTPFGDYLGGIGNHCFFAISAILFGLRYDKLGASVFRPLPFMKKRMTRLFASLWPFLIILLTIYFALGESISPIKIAMNFAGLGWFAKLPSNGHLWFVTMIILCYVMYISVVKVLNVNKLNGGIYSYC